MINLKNINSYLIKFPKYNTRIIPTSQKILYTTPYYSYDADDLNNRLSITYYPRYRLKVGRGQALQLMDNVYHQIRSDDYSRIPRTWPAFGKDGGIPEVLITSPDPVTFEDSYEIKNGGAFEPWHQDNFENLALASVIGKIISKVLAAMDVFNPVGEENYLGLIKDNSIVVNSSYKKKYATISATYKFYAGILYVKIWAAHWKDVDSRERYQLYESTDPLKILPCNIDDVPHCIHFCYDIYHENINGKWNRLESSLRGHYAQLLDDNNSYQYFQISDAFNKLLINIINMSDNFFATHSKRILLP